MKTSTLLFAVLAAIAISQTDAASLRVRRQLVPAEFRNINIESYLKNPRSVLFQLKCIVYDGPCDRIGKYLKVTIPELISGTCGHCSPQDRQTAGRLVAHIQKNYPKEWHDAIKKFQGGQVVKPEDANKFESLLGVKIESELISSTAAPVPTTLAPVSSSSAPVVEVSSTSAPAPVPVVSQVPVTASSSVAPPAVPVEPVSSAPASAPEALVVDVKSAPAPSAVAALALAPVVIATAAPSEESKPVEAATENTNTMTV